MPTSGLDPLGLEYVFSGGVSQGVQDDFNSVDQSNYGQDPNSAFYQVQNADYDVLVKETSANTRYSFNDNTLYVNPNDTDLTVMDSENGPTVANPPLIEKLAHESKHVVLRWSESAQQIEDWKDAPGAYGTSEWEEMAIDEGNRYRNSIPGKYERLWYTDDLQAYYQSLENCLPKRIRGWIPVQAVFQGYGIAILPKR